MAPMDQLLSLLYLGLCIGNVDGFLSTSHAPTSSRHVTSSFDVPRPIQLYASKDDEEDPFAEGYDEGATGESPPETIAVTISTNLSDAKVKKLFAWIKCAFAYDGDPNDQYGYYYNDIQLAIAASFGENLPKDSLPVKLLEMALKKEDLLDLIDEQIVGEDNKEWEELCVGDVIGKSDREQASLGAMGAAQWTGQFMTRPHSLLDVRNYTSVDEWIKTLPRGCKRTLKKATPEAQNFTVVYKPIRGGDAAPHSSYAHFRCVVQHEVRLLSKMYGSSNSAFINGLSEAIGRYMGTTRMAGSVREYRDSNTGKVIGFAHEASKGRTSRGQWFYCDDDAAQRFVWFHSVADLVKRAIEDDRIDTVDLGPSGSDAFTDLKQKYGFESVVDWPAAADYTSSGFIYDENQNAGEDLGDDMMQMLKQLMANKRG